MALLRNRTLWIGFLAGNLCMLAFHTTLFLKPLHYATTTTNVAGWHDTPMAQNSISHVRIQRDCHGLQGTKVLLLDLHLEGNLGDEMETSGIDGVKQLKGNVIASMFMRAMQRSTLQRQKGDGLLSACQGTHWAARAREGNPHQIAHSMMLGSGTCCCHPIHHVEHCLWKSWLGSKAPPSKRRVNFTVSVLASRSMVRMSAC